MSFEWKILSNQINSCCVTEIAKTPNGWLIKDTLFKDIEAENPISVAMIYIADRNHDDINKWNDLLDDDEKRDGELFT